MPPSPSLSPSLGPSLVRARLHTRQREQPASGDRRAARARLREAVEVCRQVIEALNVSRKPREALGAGGR